MGNQHADLWARLSPFLQEVLAGDMIAGTKQVPLDLLMQFLTAFWASQQEKTSANTTQAIILGQNLLQCLPDSSPLYSLCSFCLAQCLLITWENTDAEKKRDRQLLSIIGSRVNPAVQRCLPSDPFRAWYLDTQQTYYCIMRNFSARLEDDFWDHEHINTLNASISYARAAWHILQYNKAQARHTADNLGNVYMSRYLYLGRSGDLGEALTFNTIASVMSGQMASTFQAQSCVPQAMRVSAWSLFEDQPDEMDDAIGHMNELTEGRNWETENRDVTRSVGSSYAVQLRFFSQVYCRAFVRRIWRASTAGKYLDLAVSHSQNACAGIKEVDPGRLLCFNDAAAAYLKLYLTNLSASTLQEGVKCIITALDISETLIPRSGISRRYNGIRVSGHNATISSLVSTDDRTSSQSQFSLKERRKQRWIIETFEICANLLLARYQRDKDLQDLEMAIIALKLCIQGTHEWSPRRPKMLFKLKHALRERLRRIDQYGQVRNFLNRSSRMPASIQQFGEFCSDFGSDQVGENESFTPLRRIQHTFSVLNTDPVRNHSWQTTAPRGAYDDDMQLSTDAPNVLISDTVFAAEHIQRMHYRLDHQIDDVLGKLNSEDPETIIIRSMWNKLYCSAGASLKRAEVYQRALAVFTKNDDHESACKLSDMAEVILGQLELHLLEPQYYLSELSHGSNLAITIACIWLNHGRDPWTAILALERGRELGSRHGMNAVRSYSFDLLQELLPWIHNLRQQLQQVAGAQNREGVITGNRFTSKSNGLINVMKDYARIEEFLKPFGRQQCMLEARYGYIIHLVTSTFGTFALITTSDNFQKLPLPLCSYDQLCTRTTNFRKAIQMCENQEAHKGTANQKLRSMLAWLWKTVAKPIVKFLKLTKSSESNLPSVRWITCGIFSQLPIHAAGVYSGSSNDYLDQYAVSSYFSSIRGRLASKQRKPLVPYYQNANREFTLFGMSASPQVPEGRLSDLAVAEEKRRIFQSLGNSFTNNSVEDCNLGMARNMMHWARIIHFTCHGLPHPTDPSKSRLVLLRDDKEPCTVAEIREMEIPNALLLFLSACHSAIDPEPVRPMKSLTWPKPSCLLDFQLLSGHFGRPIKRVL